MLYVIFVSPFGLYVIGMVPQCGSWIREEVLAVMSTKFVVVLHATSWSLLCTKLWNRVFLEHPTVPYLVRKLTALYGIRRFITVFKTVWHFSLS
jgi:hypothetical protein